jgi:hypothetical protein
MTKAHEIDRIIHQFREDTSGSFKVAKQRFLETREENPQRHEEATLVLLALLTAAAGGDPIARAGLMVYSETLSQAVFGDALTAEQFETRKKACA